MAGSQTEKNYETLHEGMCAVREDVQRIEASISKITEAISRLAVLEERHQGMAASFAKLIEKVDSQTERLHKIELQNEASSAALKLVSSHSDEILTLKLAQASFNGKAQGAGLLAKGLWSVGGGVVMFLVMGLINLLIHPSAPVAPVK